MMKIHKIEISLRSFSSIKTDFIPIDYDYFDLGSKNYIRIIGRNSKGKRICILDTCDVYLWAILKKGLKENKIKEIKHLYGKDSYLIDPHGAVASLALKQYIQEENPKSYYSVILETAHPSKFNDILKDKLNINVELPDSIKHTLEQKKISIKLSNTYSLFKEFLLG